MKAGSDSKADFETLLTELDVLDEVVDNPREQRQVRRITDLANQLRPTISTVRIEKYTTRDLAQGLVGGILLSLPLLVEDGVFEIAAHFVEFTVAGVPVFLLGNVAFIIVLTIGILYWADFRDVRITKPIFGVFPRRLMGILTISFITAAGLMIMWGRVFVDDPTPIVAFARIVVIWTAAAFGAAIGDILPGESSGQDLTIENIDEMLTQEG